MMPLAQGGYPIRLSLATPLPPVTQQNGWTVLIIASCNGHLEVVSALLAAGADREAKREVRAPPLPVQRSKSHTLSGLEEQ